MSCPACHSKNVECDGKMHRCLTCGYDGRPGSGHTMTYIEVDGIEWCTRHQGVHGDGEDECDMAYGATCTCRSGCEECCCTPVTVYIEGSP